MTCWPPERADDSAGGDAVQTSSRQSRPRRSCRGDSRRSSSLVIDPVPVGADGRQNETYTLIGGRVQPQHPVERALGLFPALEPPEASPVAVQAPEEGAIVDPAPPEHAIEAIAQGQL